MEPKPRAIKLPCGICGGTYEVPLRWIERAHGALRAGCPGTDYQACPYAAFGDLVPEDTFAEHNCMMHRLSRVAEMLGGAVVTKR